MSGVKGKSGVYIRPSQVCSVEDCSKEHYAKSLCRKHYDRQYRFNHKEHILIYNRQWQKNSSNKNNSNKKYHNEYNKQWRENNPEYSKQYRQDNKEYLAERQKQWRQTFSGKASNKAGVYNRRAMTKDLTIEIIQRVYEDNIKKYGTLTCYLCFNPIEFGNDSLEHSIPLTREGSNDYKNLGVAHKICNCRKGTMTLGEWFEKYPKNFQSPTQSVSPADEIYGVIKKA